MPDQFKNVSKPDMEAVVVDVTDAFSREEIRLEKQGLTTKFCKNYL